MSLSRDATWHSTAHLIKSILIRWWVNCTGHSFQVIVSNGLRHAFEEQLYYGAKRVPSLSLRLTLESLLLASCYFTWSLNVLFAGTWRFSIGTQWVGLAFLKLQFGSNQQHAFNCLSFTGICFMDLSSMARRSSRVLLVRAVNLLLRP